MLWDIEILQCLCQVFFLTFLALFVFTQNKTKQTSKQNQGIKSVLSCWPFKPSEGSLFREIRKYAFSLLMIEKVWPTVPGFSQDSITRFLTVRVFLRSLLQGLYSSRCERLSERRTMLGRHGHVLVHESTSLKWSLFCCLERFHISQGGTCYNKHILQVNVGYLSSQSISQIELFLNVLQNLNL